MYLPFCSDDDHDSISTKLRGQTVDSDLPNVDECEEARKSEEELL